jgi:hypothetical protein
LSTSAETRKSKLELHTKAGCSLLLFQTSNLLTSIKKAFSSKNKLWASKHHSKGDLWREKPSDHKSTATFSADVHQ